MTDVLRQWETGQDNPEPIVNANFKVLEHMAVYAKDPDTTTGLTWGYLGGRWGGFTVADGTVVLTPSATNYVVVERATGDVSVSDVITNWNNAGAYARAYLLDVGVSTVTGDPADYRAGPGGVHGAAGSSGGVVSVVAGTGISVDNTDPANPVITATGGGGGGGGGGGRELLTAARTYYVRTDGSDANDGLTDASGGAFLTIQKAVDVVSQTLDMGAYQVTIQIKDGSYAAGAVLKPCVGTLTPIIQGNAVTPANVHVNIVAAATSAFICGNFLVGTFNTPGSPPSVWIVKSLKITCTQIAFWVNGAGNAIYHSGIDFGACTTAHIYATAGATIYAIGNYTISGSASNHIAAFSTGRVIHADLTVTFLANVTFTQFVILSSRGYFGASGQTYTLGGFTVTGQRYNVAQLAAIIGTGAVATYFPGSTAGAIATNGLYA